MSNLPQRSNKERIIKALSAMSDYFHSLGYAGQYQDYIQVVMFLKYISDLASSSPEVARFILPPGTNFYGLLAQSGKHDIDRVIERALREIEAANRPKLDRIFDHVQFDSDATLGPRKQRQASLSWLLNRFDSPELDFRPSAVTESEIGECYVQLISQFAANNRTFGQYTPAFVSRLLVELARPKQGDKVCDPFCGSGSLLIQAADLANSDLELFGQEVDIASWARARMNMFFHSKDSARIEWCNTFANPALVDNDRLMKFDIVVSNPPLGLAGWGAYNAEVDEYRRFQRGIPPKSRGDYAVICHMIEAAHCETGRAVLTMSKGVLFRGGAEGQIRKKLIEENLLDAVIGLPANLLANTSIPLVILVFDRSREGGANADRREVLFMDASSEFTAKKAQNIMDEAHIGRVLETYRTRAEVAGFSRNVSFEEIASNDFDLSIGRYVNISREEPKIDPIILQAEIEDLEAELSEVRAKIEYLLS